MQTRRKSRSKARIKVHTHKCSCFSCVSRFQLRLTMMGERDFALCCLPLTPCCPETDGFAVITSPQGPVCQSKWWNCLGGELEANFRPGDSLPTVVAGQQLGWTGAGSSESPCREPWTQPSRSALTGTFLPLCSSCRKSLGQGSSTQRVGP